MNEGVCPRVGVREHPEETYSLGGENHGFLYVFHSTHSSSLRWDEREFLVLFFFGVYFLPTQALDPSRVPPLIPSKVPHAAWPFARP